MSQTFFVGSYTTSFAGEQTSGQGIYTCTLERSTGQMKVKGCFRGCRNPSYLAIDEKNRYLFAVEECHSELNPAVHAFAIGERFFLEPLSSRGVPGGAPCYLALDTEKRFLTVANYATGNVLLYPVSRDGMIGNVADDVYHSGSSADLDRQEGPHPHATVFSPDNQTLYVPDLGLDEIKTYRLDTKGAKLEPLSQLKMPVGSGPRHLMFHPEGSAAFVVSELSSSLSVLQCDGPRLTLLGSVSTLPGNFHGLNTCAAVRVHPSGDFVYASNRGDDSIAVFAYEKATRQLIHLQNVSSQGQLPRDFALDSEGKLAVVANQQTNNLVSYWVDTQSGQLEPTGHQLEIGTPVCVAMTEWCW